MAMLKVLNCAGKYHDIGAREVLAEYIFNPDKMVHGFCGGVAVTENFVESMNEVAVKFKKTKGIQLRHFVLSFPAEEIDDPEVVYEIACHVARFVGRDYQVAFAVHENTENLHIHFMQNSVSYTTGLKYSGSKKDYYQLVNFLTEFLKQNYGIRLMTVSCLSDEDIQ